MLEVSTPKPAFDKGYEQQLARAKVFAQDVESLRAQRSQLDEDKSRREAAVRKDKEIEEKQLAALALRHRVPTMFNERRWVRAGGLMSYNIYHEDRMRRVAALLDKVLKGMNPAESPFELPTNSQFVVNLKTATALGLAVPPEFSGAWMPWSVPASSKCGTG